MSCNFRVREYITARWLMMPEPRSRGWTRLKALLVAVAATITVVGTASATPLRLDYTVTPIGGGRYNYEFTLTLDNHDGSWVPGTSFNWIVYGDSPTAPSPLTSFVGDPADLPIGPFPSYIAISGTHNGQNLFLSSASCSDPGAPGWVPGFVGASLSWSGTSSASLAQGALKFSNICGDAPVQANFEIARIAGACGNGVLEPGEDCDDGNTVNGDCCSSLCHFESSATVCRPAGGECDVAETCTGTSSTCPADARKTSGTACSDDGRSCTTDSCDGTSAACQHNASSCPDGLDPTFDADGYRELTIGTTAGAEAIALQSDGRLVISGWANVAGNNDFLLARLLPSGALDPSFDGDGVATTAMGTGNDLAWAVAVQPDGRIVAGGRVDLPGHEELGLARFTASGALDTGFGSGGKVVSALGGSNAVQALALQNDGSIVAVGGITSGGALRLGVARYLSNGNVDSSFASGGFTTTSTGTGGYGLAAALQTDGKILAGGYVINGNVQFQLARYLTNGSLDPAFGSGGVVTTAPGTGDEIHALAIQGDGRIVAAGIATISGVQRFAVARYLSTGALDPSFGSGGIATFPVGAFSSDAYAVRIEGDGKIVVAGWSNDGGAPARNFATIRLTTAGALDPAFGTGGKVITTLSALDNDEAHALAIQDNGGIVDVGRVRVGSADHVSIVRYVGDSPFVDTAPTADAGRNQTVQGPTVVTLDGSGSFDPDPGQNLAYSWTQTGGPAVTLSSSTAQKPTFVAPAPASGADFFYFQLTVSDGHGGTSTADTTIVHVLDVPPSANLGPDRSVIVSTEVIFGNALPPTFTDAEFTYQWLQTAGTPVTLSSLTAAHPLFIAPTLPATLTFQVTVTEIATGLVFAPDSINILVQDTAPIANAGPDQQVPVSSLVALDGTASLDPDPGQTLTYTWTQLSGTPVTLSDATVPQPTFTAPPSAGTLTFGLVVDDGHGSTNADSVDVVVQQPSVCGNGTIEAGEQCDDGNTVNGDCCSSTCHVESAGTVCRSAAGECDVAETCDGSSPSCPTNLFQAASHVCRLATGECDVAEHCSGTDAGCPANGFVAAGMACTDDGQPCTNDACDGAGTCAHQPLPDSDGDSVCDAQDACTNVGGGQNFVVKPKSKVTLSKINTDTTPGNDKLVMGGSFNLPTGIAFAGLDPLNRGARVVLKTSLGAVVLDVQLPVGAYTGNGTRGWKTNGKQSLWQYIDKTGAPLSGIVGLKATDRSKGASGGLVAIAVSGKNGTYPVTVTSSPLEATVVLGNQSDAIAGKCGESAYSASDCRYNAPGNSLKCMR